MQGGAPMFDASADIGMSVKVLKGVYAHHHPDAGRSVHAAMERRRPAPIDAIGDDARRVGRWPTLGQRLLALLVRHEIACRRTGSAQFDREQNVTIWVGSEQKR
jgi:hypothetical protein